MLTRVLLVAAAINCVVGTLLIPGVHVETVVGTGPVLAVLGTALVIAGLLAEYSAAWLLGTVHWGICILFFVLVVTLHWSPQDAHIPFMVMGMVYTSAIVPITWRAFWRAPRVIRPGECASCGYLLYGLQEPRCPECGAAFDAGQLPSLAASAKGT